MQGFCKEFVTWKALCHPNLVPLLGVMMTETRFAIVSEWMMNGDINQFVKTRQEVNRFELVRPRSGFRDPRSPLTIVTSPVGRCHSGLDLPARPGDGARGPQRGGSQFSASLHL